ncbi:uncharacterized protein LOC108850558 [Raphanus sativus]|uniref:Uncharacterized protein LOC108850558 n=1 Tax=Raphanus sativus TaxID=3726 RepID=A0A6J0N662_RAPSA|nr:uncharacterized protein LOC108850558 [Raphanus sativus]
MKENILLTTSPSTTRQLAQIDGSNDAITCKTDAAWDKNTKTAGFGWVLEGPPLIAPIHGSASQSFIGSPLVAEALAMRSALCMAQTRGIASLRVFTDNSTLVRAISGKHQSKEIIGVVHDIRVISSDFASISFSYFSRSKNSVADALAKASLQFHIL